MKRILIEWFHCDRKEPACQGPAKDRELIEGAIEAVRPFMRTMQVQLDFREVTLRGDEAQRADTVKINGKKIEELIDAAHEKTPCGYPANGCAGPDAVAGPSLPGRNAADLSEMLVDAILRESGRFARCGCGCSPDDLLR
jgi:hypothetical protein